MERFVRTGKLSDHIWCLRPFTPVQRRAVLTHIIDLYENGTYRHLHFLTDDSLLVDREATLYGRTGLCLMNSGTSYLLSGDRPETLICRRRVMDSFTAFFDEALLGNSVLSEADSIAYMRSLLKMLDDIETEA